MRRPSSDLSIFGVCLSSLLLASPAYAQIYRWVDENGRTHYSEKKEEAGKAKTDELRFKPQPASPQGADSSAQHWRDQESQFRQRRIQAGKDQGYRPPAATRPQSLSGGREDGTDASRCSLARDVLSGAVHHRNGAPTDSYDRQVAENDVRTFCH
jgi:hypothetical protein